MKSKEIEFNAEDLIGAVEDVRDHLRRPAKINLSASGGFFVSGYTLDPTSVALNGRPYIFIGQNVACELARPQNDFSHEVHPA